MGRGASGTAGPPNEEGSSRSSVRAKRGASSSEADNYAPNSAKRGRRNKSEVDDKIPGALSSSLPSAAIGTSQSRSQHQVAAGAGTSVFSPVVGVRRVAGDKGPAICDYPLSGPWISSHAIHPDPVVIKRPNESIESKWGMQLYHDITQWGEDWAVVMVSSPGPQKTLSIGDIVLGVNGVPLGGKTFTQAMNLLKDSGIYCHLAVARFQGCMTVLVQVPENVCGGDLILAKSPDGNSVEVTVPSGLKGGDKFQLQVKQPQYNSKSALLASNAAKSGSITDRETRYRQNQLLFQQEHQKYDHDHQGQIQPHQPSKDGTLSVDLVVSPSDPSVIISGDFNEEEMRAIITGVSVHGKEWDVILSDSAFGGTLKNRASAACQAKWEQCVALFSKRGEELMKGSEKVASSMAKKGKGNKKSKRGSDVIVASAAPGLRTCILCAVIETTDSEGEGPPRAIDILHYISCVWGSVYQEPSHADFSWSERGLKGAVAGKGAVSEFVRNAAGPGQLSFKAFKFLVDDSSIRAMRERSRSGSTGFGVDEVCVHEFLRNRTNLMREIDKMADENILVVDGDGGITLGACWVDNIGFEVLTDFHQNWGENCKETEKYCVSDSASQSISAAWTKEADSWTLVKCGSKVFGSALDDIKVRYQEMFEKWAQPN